MKEVMTKMYETLDGTLFTSPSEAKQYESDLLNSGVMAVEAQVTRNTARVYALWLMDEGGGSIQGKECWHFGRCEIEKLLDLIYGFRRDGTLVSVHNLIDEMRK